MKDVYSTVFRRTQVLSAKTDTQNIFRSNYFYTLKQPLRHTQTFIKYLLSNTILQQLLLN